MKRNQLFILGKKMNIVEIKNTQKNNRLNTNKKS